MIAIYISCSVVVSIPLKFPSSLENLAIFPRLDLWFYKIIKLALKQPTIFKGKKVTMQDLEIFK